MRTRYSHLVPSSPPSRPIRLWASDSSRVIDTARYFASGFFGSLSWASSTGQLIVIPETADLGADTLTPGDTCLNYRRDPHDGHDKGIGHLLRFRETYLPRVGARFARQNRHVPWTFSTAELYSMQELCGFETLVRGASPWCDAFGHDDWRHFEYARDLIHYYRAGPGNGYGATMGWLWLNATAALLAADPADVGSLFFSFVHDGDIVPMLAALDLFPDEQHLPVDRVDGGRAWRMSSVTPMGGRVILERLACSASASASSKTEPEEGGAEEEVFIRINVNDGIVAHPQCHDGPGKSCPLGQFLELVKRRGREVGDFREKCGLSSDAPDRITFLHQ